MATSVLLMHSNKCCCIRVLTRRWGIRRDHLIIILYRPLWSCGLLEMAPPVLPVRSCVQLLLRARTNIICTGVINESPSSRMMNKSPLGGQPKVHLQWHQKSFLGRQPPSSFGRTKKYVSPLIPHIVAVPADWLDCPGSAARNFVRAPRLCQEFPKHAKVYLVCEKNSLFVFASCLP